MPASKAHFTPSEQNQLLLRSLQPPVLPSILLPQQTFLAISLRTGDMPLRLPSPPAAGRTYQRVITWWVQVRAPNIQKALRKLPGISVAASTKIITCKSSPGLLFFCISLLWCDWPHGFPGTRCIGVFGLEGIEPGHYCKFNSDYWDEFMTTWFSYRGSDEVEKRHNA